ncbi:MAG TPA: hypothetical protein VM657_09015 [Sphingomonas sp.]|nr:hypothetical protein [Sphingomonas sp.]
MNQWDYLCCTATKRASGKGPGAQETRTMRNYETTAFGAVALIAQALVVAAIFVG